MIVGSTCVPVPMSSSRSFASGPSALLFTVHSRWTARRAVLSFSWYMSYFSNCTACTISLYYILAHSWAVKCRWGTVLQFDRSANSLAEQLLCAFPTVTLWSYWYTHCDRITPHSYTLLVDVVSERRRRGNWRGPGVSDRDWRREVQRRRIHTSADGARRQAVCGVVTVVCATDWQRTGLGAVWQLHAVVPLCLPRSGCEAGVQVAVHSVCYRCVGRNRLCAWK